MQRSSLIPLRSTSILLAVSIAGFTASGAAPPPPPAPSTPSSEVSAEDLRRQIAIARKAMDEQKWLDAAEAWRAAESMAPNRAELPYNRGVAAYRAGRLEEAAEGFRTAAKLGDADLAARAMYNEGTVRFAEAIEKLDASESTSSPATPPATNELQDAIDRVGSSLDHFRDAIDADPENLDARVNAELAHRLLRQLEQIQQQQQQQGQNQQQEQQEQQEQGQTEGEGDDQDQDQQDQEGEQSSESSEAGRDGDEDEQQPSSSEGSQDSEGSQPPPDQESSEDDPSEDPADSGQDEAGEDSQSSPSEETEGAEQDREGDSSAESEARSEEEDAAAERLTREEAERLLQSVRDKERQRRRAKARQEQVAPKTPVEKDW